MSAGVSGLGVAIGALAGGYLLEHLWWGSIFLVNVPIVIVTVTVIVAVMIVPDSRAAHAAQLDLLGTMGRVMAGQLRHEQRVLHHPERHTGVVIVTALSTLSISSISSISSTTAP